MLTVLKLAAKKYKKQLPNLREMDIISNFTIGLKAPSSRTEKALWFAFRGRELLLYKKLSPLAVPKLKAFEELGLQAQRLQYLGVLGRLHCYSVELEAEAEAPKGMEFLELKRAYELLGKNCFFLANKAVQIMEWDRTTQYCSRCGKKTEKLPQERGKKCPNCKELFFPRISPAIIVLIKKGKELLLVRAPDFPKGVYSLVAGFVEPGESAEAAVIREVWEEVGIRIKNLNYFGTQPWPFPNSLMIGFSAEYESGKVSPDGLEIEAAAWFSAEKLPALPGKISIARKLIEHFLKEEKLRKEGFFYS